MFSTRTDKCYIFDDCCFCLVWAGKLAVFLHQFSSVMPSSECCASGYGDGGLPPLTYSLCCFIPVWLIYGGCTATWLYASYMVRYRHSFSIVSEETKACDILLWPTYLLFLIATCAAPRQSICRWHHILVCMSALIKMIGASVCASNSYWLWHLFSVSCKYKAVRHFECW